MRRLLRGLLHPAREWLIRTMPPPVKRRVKAWLPYRYRLERELANYAEDEHVHALPEIFHYWSNKYLLPKYERFGFSDPEDFFYQYALKQVPPTGGAQLRVVSIGAGNCDMEARLARRLTDAGVGDFVVECLDINPSMLERGLAHARALGVERHLTTTETDFNRWTPEGRYQVIIANQCLHHVVDLESLFFAIRTALAPAGIFLASDMIGRNGHQRWPEALTALKPFWDELPPEYRYNHVFKRRDRQFVNHDWSLGSFEGIRAQDILPLLVENFHFELFIPFANIVLAFIDRPFGPNFSVERDWDRDFIDRVHAYDEEAIIRGELKPTQMIAALRLHEAEADLVHPLLTPQFCIRRSGEPGKRLPA